MLEIVSKPLGVDVIEQWAPESERARQIETKESDQQALQLGHDLGAQRVHLVLLVHAKRVTEVRRAPVDQLGAELVPTGGLVPCPAMGTGYVELAIEPLLDQLAEDFAAKMSAADRVLVSNVGIGRAEEQQLHELGQSVGAKDLARHSSTFEFVADVDDSGAATAELLQLRDREGAGRPRPQTWGSPHMPPSRGGPDGLG